MGSKPIFPLGHSRRVPAQALLAGAFALALGAFLISCISDGPNRTGAEYLGEHGIVLRNPLYHVTVKAFPVDSFWTTDAEPSHVGDSVLLAGRSQDFTAEPRLAFHLADTSMLDSLASAETTLRLSLAPYQSPFSAEELKTLAAGDTVRKLPGQDSLRFEVMAWVKKDSGIASKAWSDTLNAWNSRFLTQQEDLASLLAAASLDTISLKIATAYTRDTLQSLALPGLQRYLLASGGGFKHLIQLHLRPIDGPDADSVSAMLRLGGWLGDADRLHRGPLLLFGKPANAAAANKNNRLQAQGLFVSAKNRDARAVSYILYYNGPRTDMLATKGRGLHMVLDRATLLDSIDAALVRNGVTPPPRATGDHDLSYFVPFAKMTLPLANPSLEAGFPLDMRMFTKVDTLLGDTLQGGIREDAIPDDSSKVIWYTTEVGHPERILDDVSIAYEGISPTVHRVVLAFSKDSARNDTTFITRGEIKQWVILLPGYGSESRLQIELEAGEVSLLVRSYLVTGAFLERNDYKDPETGKTLTELADQIPRFLHPGDSALSLRATHGFQALLNRTRLGKNALMDFEIRPLTPQAAVDSTVSSQGKNVGARVPYPVLSVIPPKLEENRLQVDLELYLYPLKAR